MSLPEGAGRGVADPVGHPLLPGGRLRRAPDHTRRTHRRRRPRVPGAAAGARTCGRRAGGGDGAHRTLQPLATVPEHYRRTRRTVAVAAAFGAAERDAPGDLHRRTPQMGAWRATERGIPGPAA